MSCAFPPRSQPKEQPRFPARESQSIRPFYSPLRHWGPGKYHKLAVVGLGGLGHMAVKIARAMGTEVTVLSTSERKRRDAERLDAAHFAVTSHATTFSQLQRRFEFILNTVSAPHNYNAYLNLLKPTAP
jgi:uncharacterized zinc-type alcohol dehydrogenase-like protein